MPPRQPSRFDKAAAMTEREKKRFRLMYEDPETYSAKDIAMSFGVSLHSISAVAKQLGCKIRTKVRT